MNNPNPAGYQPNPTRRTLSGKRVPIVFRKERSGLFGNGQVITVTDHLLYNGVPANVKARRRAANKAARVSRRINRGQR